MIIKINILVTTLVLVKEVVLQFKLFKSVVLLTRNYSITLSLTILHG